MFVRSNLGASQRINPARFDSLSGRVAIITGGGSGIGAAFVRGFAGNAARIAFLNLDEAAGEALSQETGGRFFACDLCDIPAVEAIVRRIGTEFGLASVLFNNARPRRRDPGWRSVSALIYIGLPEH
jgi:NAD(P)-dependent dehydrogenase (short-subunit alcohol dehydrogenase family)